MSCQLPQFNAWPVLYRELCEGARRKTNHRLRLLSAGVGTLVLWLVTSHAERSVLQTSGWLLSSLHTWFLALVFVVVPVLTADCIAREKREGTLGLLFLTPLSAGGIVAGKLLAQVLRVLTLWLAVLPLLTISFLSGGITWFDALSALSLEFCATVLSLAAGLLASALARERGTAFMCAYLLSALFWLLLIQGFQLVMLLGWRGLGMLQQWDWLRMSLGTLPLFAGMLDFGVAAGWRVLGAVSPVLASLWKWLCIAGPPGVIALCWLVGALAAFTIERSWQDKVPSARRQSWVRRYCTPLFERHCRRRNQQCLDWNPIAWLQRYSWKARLSRLGLCLGFLVLAYVVPGLSVLSPGNFLTLLLLILAGAYSFVGVSGFLEEKKSGALELLLVTPLSPGQLILGRAWGLWKQFLPASLVVAGFHVFVHSRAGWSDHLPLEVGLVCSFFTLPVFATYFALRIKHLILAAVLTWVALGLPMLFAIAATDLFVPAEADRAAPLPLLVVGGNAAFALLACGLLRHSLARRIYSF